MSAEILRSISGLGTVFLACAFFFFFWQSFVVDQARDGLFELRDRWFDFSQGLSEADRLAAGGVRRELDHLTRFTCHFTFPVFVCTLIVRALGGAFGDGAHELDRLISNIESAEARVEARRVMELAMLQVAWCMARRSVVLVALLPVAAVAFVLIAATVGGARSIGISAQGLLADLTFERRGPVKYG